MGGRNGREKARRGNAAGRGMMLMLRKKNDREKTESRFGRREGGKAKTAPYVAKTRART